MKEKIKFIILIIVFVGGLFLITGLLDKQNQEMVNNAVAHRGEEILDELSSTDTEIEEDNIGESEDISNNSLEKDEVNESIENIKYIKENEFEKEVLNSKQTVLVDFYADWCMPCQYLSPIIEEFAKDNPDIKIIKVDVDEAMNLSYEYSATSIPTLVVFKNGKEVNRAVGLMEQSEIEKLVK